MATLRLLVPDATTNYIKNPSARFDTTDVNVSGATVTRTLDYARHGIASYKVVTAGSVLREGIYYRVNDLQGINDTITVSAYVRGNGYVRIRLLDNSPTSGAQWYSKSTRINSTRWTRIEVSGRCSGSNDIRLYVETDGKAAQAITFYVDSMQMERHSYSTTYCDGDQPGCRWNIIQHASQSSRDTYTRQGGRWVSLSGPEQTEKDLYMTVIGGLGMAPIQNQTQSFATAPGSFFQGSKVNSRVVTFTFNAKHKNLPIQKKEASLKFLHQLRQLMIDIVKPDKTGGDEPFLMEYTDGATPLYFWARYDGGLEGEWDIRNQWVNAFPLRVIIVSPMLFEDNQELYNMKFQESFIANNIVGRVNGEWKNMNYGTSWGVGDLEYGRKGEIYMSGNYSLVNNDDAAVDPKIYANGISYWDGVKFNKLSSGVLNIGGIGGNTVNDMAVAPNGYVYITGRFTSVGGVAANNVAYWNGSTWNAMGAGLNGDGAIVSVAPNGEVYVGGAFTTAGGQNCRYIAKWDGSSWKTIGTYGGLNWDVRSLSISPDGTTIYVCGIFSDQYSLSGNALLRVAKYNVSTNTFSAIGSGFNQEVIDIIISPSGIVYCCGIFTASGTTTINHVAQLQGNTWIPMGSGINAQVESLDVSINGDVVAVGYIQTAGGNPVAGVALWNGSSWANLDAWFLAPTYATLGALFTPQGDLYICGTRMNTSSVQSKFSAITYITNNGTAEVSPFIYILGQGTLRWLENQTTKKRVFMNLTILSGEEVFIDFGQGKITSTVRGDLSYSVLPGSDFGSFTLVPGENKLAAMMTDDVGAVMKIGYTPSHWSADATQNVEAF